MILFKLIQLESKTKKKLKKEQKRLMTITAIKTMLIQIDFTSEIVTTNSFNSLQQLLRSIKGQRLTKREINLVKQLFTNK